MNEPWGMPNLDEFPKIISNIFICLSSHMTTYYLYNNYFTSHLTWKMAEIFTSCQWSCILFKNKTDIVVNDGRSCSGVGGNLRTFSLEDAMERMPISSNSNPVYHKISKYTQRKKTTILKFSSIWWVPQKCTTMVAFQRTFKWYKTLLLWSIAM